MQGSLPHAIWACHISNYLRAVKGCRQGLCRFQVLSPIIAEAHYASAHRQNSVEQILHYRRYHHGSDRSPSSRFPEYGHSARVPSKVLDVVSDPLQSSTTVPDTVIPLSGLVTYSKGPLAIDITWHR